MISVMAEIEWKTNFQIIDSTGLSHFSSALNRPLLSRKFQEQTSKEAKAFLAATPSKVGVRTAARELKRLENILSIA